jgi:hypothetical protein
MSPRSKVQNKGFSEGNSVEKLGIVDLFPLKHSGKKYYVTISPRTVNAYDLLPADLLKIQLIEVRKHREIADELKLSEDEQD